MKRVLWGFFWVFVELGAGGGSALLADDEDLVVTPAGFSRPGVAQERRAGRGAGGSGSRFGIARQIGWRLAGSTSLGRMETSISRRRIGSHRIASRGSGPRPAKEIGPGKGPFRYLGRFFYTTGEIEVAVPAGLGSNRSLERISVSAGGAKCHGQRRRNGDPRHLSLSAQRPMAAMGYFPGDLHLHFPRRDEADDQTILDLLEAEDIALRLDSGLQRAGRPVQRSDGDDGCAPASWAGSTPRSGGAGQTWIASGQEYRSTTYGHLNLYWRDDLVLAGRKTNADNWPLYGQLGRETMREGGLAIYAHGGYSQAIHADFVQKRRERSRAASVRRVSRNRAGRLVRHPEHRLSIPVRRGKRLPRLPQAGRLPDVSSGSMVKKAVAGWLKAAGGRAELRHERAAAVARSRGQGGPERSFGLTEQGRTG